MSVAILDRTIVTRTVPISKAITIWPRCPPSRAGADRWMVLLHERKTRGRRTNDMRPTNMNGNMVMAIEPVTKAQIAHTATSKADPRRRKDDDRVATISDDPFGVRRTLRSAASGETMMPGARMRASPTRTPLVSCISLFDGAAKRGYCRGIACHKTSSMARLCADSPIATTRAAAAGPLRQREGTK